MKTNDPRFSRPQRLKKTTTTEGKKMKTKTLKLTLATLAATAALGAASVHGYEDPAKVRTRQIAGSGAAQAAKFETEEGYRLTAVSKPMIPKTVFNRKRLISMDAETLPGKCIYTYAQGTKTWCETNDVRALEFRAVKNRYSKLKIVTAAKAAGKWDALKAGIAAADLEDEWAACQYIEDGDPAFVSATNAVVAAGIATAEEIAAFLKSAIDN